MNVTPSPISHSATESPHAPRVPNIVGAALMRRAAWASVSVAALLIAAKLVAYVLTGSVAILAALADSAVDLVASLVNLVAVRHAVAPSDDAHRFGHGKAEPLAGLAQALFITASAIFLTFESVQRLLEPQAVENGMVGIAVILFSIAATAGLVAFQRSVIRRTGSPAISADSAHFSGDLLANFGVIVALVLSSGFGWHLADPLIGLGIAGIIGWSAWHVFRTSYDQLMDHELPEPAREHIKEIALGHHQVKGVHDLRTRAAGTLSFIQLHIEMDPALSLAEVHDVSDAIEHDLHKAFPGAEIIIHQDPHGAEQPPPLALS